MECLILVTRISSTSLLVIVGFITAGVIGWQSWETRKAAEAARESILLSHRPKLIVRNVVSPQLELLPCLSRRFAALGHPRSI
jgi:predicted negative regulator of RcsB-dependent stress response